MNVKFYRVNYLYFFTLSYFFLLKSCRSLQPSSEKLNGRLEQQKARNRFISHRNQGIQFHSKQHFQLEVSASISQDTSGENIVIPSSSPSSSSSIATDVVPQKIWPCGDDLDNRILRMVGPAALNFAMFPLVGAIDTYWVGQMKQALALAGQGAANRIFSSAFWIISFLPTIVTPLIAEAAGSNDKEALQNHVADAVLLGLIVGGIGTSLIMKYTNIFLRLALSKESQALEYARSYLFVRAITFIPALLSTVGFSVFRGTMDVITPLKIGVLSNIVNILLDPILIFTMRLGVTGAAAATCIAELLSFILFTYALIKREILKVNKLFRIPSFSSLKTLLLGSISILLRSAALEVTYLSLMSKAQSLDHSGTVAAAHAISMQLWDIGAYLLYSVGVVATVIVPSEYAKAQKENSKIQAVIKGKIVADRMILWGLGLGSIMAIIHLFCLPILKTLSPLKEVQELSRIPGIIGAGLQILSGLVFVGEGIQMGSLYFTSLTVSTVLSMFIMLGSLRLFGNTLTGVWWSFTIMLLSRLLFTLRHHFYEGPYALKNINDSKV